MLRITVDHLPHGRVDKARTIARALIWNKGRDHSGHCYGVRLSDFPDGPNIQSGVDIEDGEVRNYPRWSAPVWDLVARALHRGMQPKSKEFNLGFLPKALSEVVPVCHSQGVAYIRVADVPDFAREHFKKFLFGKMCPLIDGEDPMGCAHVQDFHRFLAL